MDRSRKITILNLERIIIVGAIIKEIQETI